MKRMAAYNRRLAQWRLMWLIEHSTSHQLLWCIDSFVLRNPPLRQAPKRYVIWHQKSRFEINSTIVTHYKLLLSGYYAQEYSEGILRNPINFSKKFTPTIHKVVAPDGTYHWVIGYFLTEEEARGTQVHDAVIPNPRMVFISPTIYKVLP